jgi:hypothetical protein
MSLAYMKKCRKLEWAMSTDPVELYPAVSQLLNETEIGYAVSSQS